MKRFLLTRVELFGAYKFNLIKIKTTKDAFCKQSLSFFALYISIKVGVMLFLRTGIIRFEVQLRGLFSLRSMRG